MGGHVAEPDTPRLLRDAEGNTFELRERSCPTCGPAAQRMLGWRGGAMQRYGLGVSTRIVQCGSCGLVFPNPFPYPHNAGRLYGDPEKFFTGHTEAGKLRRARHLIQRLQALSGLAQPSLLDVGSGRGELLLAARLEGLRDIVGLETSPAMIDCARRQHELALTPLTIEQYGTEAGRRFDAVILNAVLEHVEDPDAMIGAAAALTRPGGWLYIDTPNEPNLITRVGNAVNRLRGSRAVFNLSPTWIPYHVFGFNPGALRVLLRKHGFEVRELRVHAAPTVPTRGGWRDRAAAMVATQIGKVANATGTAANLYAWAQRVTAQDGTS